MAQFEISNTWKHKPSPLKKVVRRMALLHSPNNQSNRVHDTAQKTGDAAIAGWIKTTALRTARPCITTSTYQDDRAVRLRLQKGSPRDGRNVLEWPLHGRYGSRSRGPGLAFPLITNPGKSVRPGAHCGL
jgi:hypothetical protein